MKISTRGRYALRVMVDLAEHYSDAYIPLVDIATRQEISFKYVETIMTVLSKKGLVEGKHGKSGGYRLNKQPTEYKVADILIAAEGNIAPVACLECDVNKCSRKDKCKTLPLWQDFQRKINDYFSSVLLSDLIDTKAGNQEGLNQFTRTEMLLGRLSTAILSKKKVVIFGIGGVGGNVCDSLARSGIGHFLLVDNDKVSITNINRQYVANMKTIGEYKVNVMERHIKSVNPSAIVEKKIAFYLPENSKEFNFKDYDYVVDAIDTVTAKLDIITKCHELGIPVISALGCGNKMDPTQLEVTDISKTSYDPLAKVMRRELRNRGINHLKVVYSKELPLDIVEQIETSKEKRATPGSTPFVPPVAGIIVASEVVKDLLK